MIVATFPPSALTAAPPDAPRRTIAGTAVPYEVPGVVSDGTEVIFHAGSIDPSARPVLLRDHDRHNPIGVVVDAVDTGAGLDATARVSRTPAGDDALVLAADGALSMFSVGAEPTDWHVDDAGVMHVHAADWHELSLLTHGAYPAARVRTVTATVPTQENPTMTDVQALPTDAAAALDDDDDLVDDDALDLAVADHPAQLALAVEAGRPAVVPLGGPRVARRPGDEMTLRAIGPLLQAARAGNRDAARRLTTAFGRYTVEAALSDVTMVGGNNVGNMWRPAYQPEIIDIVSHGAPLTEVIRQGDLLRGDFPNKSWLMWTNTPKPVTQATEKAAIGSGPVGLAPAQAPVQTWAVGNDISQQTIDFGPASFVEDYIRVASMNYATTIDVYAATVLLAAATAVTTVAGDTFVGVVAKLFAALNPANVPAGRLFLATSWDVAAGLIGTTEMNGPAFWDVSIDLGNFIPPTNAGGLIVFVDPNLPARTYLLGLTSAATWYDVPGVPYTLQAVNVGQLGLDVAVYGYGCCGVQFPLALVKTTQP